nr:uncharacterized protein LOC115262427 [Aedes albopictus]
MQHLSTVSNFCWLCNQCIETIRKQRSDLMADQQDKNGTLPKANEVSRIDGEIAKLKEEIASLHYSLHSITPRVEANKTEDPNAHRPLAESSLLCLSDNQQSTQHSGRLSSAAVEQRAPNDRFWLYFTRVKNYVTERQILEFVTDSLGTDDAVVKKLVPAWKDTLSMPYVSFKVGVDVRLKETALLPSTWPAGLRFREFREDVWEPL